MLYYAQMRWELKGMTFDELWDLEAQEAVTGVATIESGFVKHLYEVATKQRVVAFADVPSLEDLDRTAMGRLPMHEHLIFEETWALEEGYTHPDVPGYLKQRRERMDSHPKLLHMVEFAWDESGRALDGVWDALVKRLSGMGDEGSTTTLGIYRVAGRQRALLLVDVESAGDLNGIARLPELAAARVTRVDGLRDYIQFAADVGQHFKNI